jgi:hypothetical protein
LTYNEVKVDLSASSNQWYMLSAPLRNTYSGDYYVDTSNPHTDLAGRGMLVYMMHFDIGNYQSGAPRIPYNWNDAFHTNDILLQAGQGFALYAEPRNSNYGNDELLTDTFRFPKYDAYHNYYSLLGAVTGRGNDLERTIGHGRFIYESNDSLPPAGGLVNLHHSSLATNQMVLVGNPFMAQLDFEKFVADPNNRSLIFDEYKIAYGQNLGTPGAMNDFVTYKGIGGDYVPSNPSPEDLSLTQYIAPMQSFIVYSRTNGGQLTADIANHTETSPIAPSNTLRSSQDKKVFYVTASRGQQKSSAALVHWNEGNKDFYAEEDSRKLFNEDERASTSVIVYLLSKDGIALDINTTNDLTEMIPIGIRTSALGKMTLNFSGTADFVGYKIELHDTKENRIIDLNKESEYVFFKMEQESYLDNRFFLRFDDGVSINNVNSLEIFISNPRQNTIRVVSLKAIENIEILDMQGRILTRTNNINNTMYDYQVNVPGVYMVRIAGQTKKVVVK